MKYYKNMDKCIRYFVVAEYGSDERYTHRPHYHVLFFVSNPSLSVVELRNMAHSAWSRGRTDTVRFNGNKANYFNAKNSSSEYGLCNYVAKYVQKDSLFNDRINMRLLRYMDYFCEHHKESINKEIQRVVKEQETGNWIVRKLRYCGTYVQNSFLHSQTYKKEFQRVRRLVCPFHNQSRGFGMQVLSELKDNIGEVIENGYLTMPDSYKVVKKIPLPKYFIRKLFEEKVEKDGFVFWIKNELGKRFMAIREKKMLEYLSNKLRTINLQYRLFDGIDCDKLARYAMYYKGRVKALMPEIDMLEKLKLPRNLRLFNYSTPKIRQWIHESCLSFDYLVTNGSRVWCDKAIPLSHFLRSRVIDDSYCREFNGFDKILKTLFTALSDGSVDSNSLVSHNKALRNQYAAYCLV